MSCAAAHVFACLKTLTPVLSLRSIKASALIATRDWEALRTWALAKKSPIGYEPLISRLVAAGQVREALQYVGKCAADKADKAKLR